MVTQGEPSPAPRFLIEAIRQRYKTGVRQDLEPVFVIGRVTCTEVLIDRDEEDEDEGAHNEGEYMYSYRMELQDIAGEKIIGVLRPRLHASASQELFSNGAIVKLTDWRVGEAKSRNGKEVLFLDIEEFELLAEEQEEEESGVAEETAASSLIGGSGSSSATRPALITSTNTQVEEQLRREAEQGQDGSGGLSIVPTSDNQHGKALYDVPAGQQKDNKKDEENYDDIADSILGSVSFKSTVPGTVEFIHSEKQVAAVAAITEPGVSADLPSQRAKPSQVKPVALSALGKRFLDSRSLPESSVSTQSSEEPMTKKSRTESIDDDFTTPIKPKAAAHPALIPTPAAKLNLPPHLAPRTPTGFSSASALHEQYQQITSPSFATPSRSSNIWNQLRPCRLADLPSRPHGSKVDILAIIYSIDSTLITRNKSIKRDCRLVDPSSPPLVPPPTQPHLKKPHHNELKPTVLSIWVKPQSFCPKPGTLVAFRGLTVHRYAGRSLNAFSDVAGSVWYLANPGEEIDGAEEVEEWWTDRCMRIVAEEAEREAEREMLEKQKDSGEGRKPAVEFEV